MEWLFTQGGSLSGLALGYSHAAPPGLRKGGSIRRRAAARCVPICGPLATPLSLVGAEEQVERAAPRIAPLCMTRRKIAWLALLMALTVAGLLRYSWSVQSARPRRVVVGRDVSDAPSVKPAQAKSGYDPYFVRVNHSANTTLPGTNTKARTP